MSLKELCRKMLVVDEGVRYKPYSDTVGKTTIGIGRNLDDVGISEAEALYLLDNDIYSAELAVRRILGDHFFVSLSENRQAALINLLFNLGEPKFLKFTNTIKAIKNQDWNLVALHLKDSKWARQVGKRSERVLSMLKNDIFPY